MKIAESFFKWIENDVGKGEIARCEQFLLFPQCFKEACFPGASKGVIVWEWVLMQFLFMDIFNTFSLEIILTFSLPPFGPPFIDILLCFRMQKILKSLGCCYQTSIFRYWVFLTKYSS